MYVPFQYYPPDYAKVSLLVSTLEVFRPKLCEHSVSVLAACSVYLILVTTDGKIMKQAVLIYTWKVQSVFPAVLVF